MTSAATTTPDALRTFPCKQCGGRLEFLPGRDVLTCPFCGSENAIAQPAGIVEEIDYQSTLSTLEKEAPRFQHDVVKCGVCNAQFEKPGNLTAMSCPYCGSNIVATAHVATHIKPGAVLPFALPRDQAVTKFRAWLKGLWFAPSALKREGFVDAGVTGTYVPAWTYDARATTQYTGQRGDAYYETEWVTVNGQRQSRQVRRIRWSSAAGEVEDTFDDLLVLASHTLPEKRVQALQPWDLERLVPYNDEYLAGFRAECYQTTLPEGFEEAKGLMRPRIESSIRSDIGGDEQRISSMRTRYDDVTFKHILLPVWVSAYRFNNTVYQFIVNARTGEVTGDRPYSAIKITLFVLMCLAIVAIVVLLAARG